MGSLDQNGDLCGYVHNSCDLWESDILLTGFTSSSAGRWTICLGGVKVQQMPEVLNRCSNTVALSNLTSSTNGCIFGLLYTKGQLRLRFRLPLVVVVSECRSRGFFPLLLHEIGALHLGLAFAESCPPHLRPRACALVRNNLG